MKSVMYAIVSSSSILLRLAHLFRFWKTLFVKKEFMVITNLCFAQLITNSETFRISRRILNPQVQIVQYMYQYSYNNPLQVPFYWNRKFSLTLRTKSNKKPWSFGPKERITIWPLVSKKKPDAMKYGRRFAR